MGLLGSDLGVRRERFQSSSLFLLSKAYLTQGTSTNIDCLHGGSLGYMHIKRLIQAA